MQTIQMPKSATGQVKQAPLSRETETKRRNIYQEFYKPLIHNLCIMLALFHWKMSPHTKHLIRLNY